MTENTQLLVDLEDRIQWFHQNADRHRRWYEGLKALQILCGFSIPVCSLLIPNAEQTRIINGILGSAIAGIESYVQFRQFDKHWQRWRSTAVALVRERRFFQAQAGPYANPALQKPSALLAERMDEILSKEHKDWADVQTKKAAKEHKAGSGGTSTSS